MVKFAKGALLAAAVSMALGGIASAQVNDAEFKCQQKVSKAGSKFVGKKAKCASKCISASRKDSVATPISDCFAPYGGATASCVTDPIKGAEGKFAQAILKACDSNTTPTADCPECYTGGDCSLSGEAGDRVQNIEGQVDSFGPGVFCDQQGANPPNADDDETKCELNTAKVLSKQVKTLNKCYDKCESNARKGLISQASCDPPASDPDTAACVSNGDTKTIDGVNKKCSDVGAVPDCAGPDDYPSGAVWTVLVDSAITGQIPGTYCDDSPSGAFLE